MALNVFNRTAFQQCSRCGRDVYPGEPCAINENGRFLHCMHCMGLDGKNLYRAKGWLRIKPTVGWRMKHFAAKRGKKTEREIAEWSNRVRFPKGVVHAGKAGTQTSQGGPEKGVQGQAARQVRLR